VKTCKAFDSITRKTFLCEISTNLLTFETKKKVLPEEEACSNSPVKLLFGNKYQNDFKPHDVSCHQFTFSCFYSLVFVPLQLLDCFFPVRLSPNVVQFLAIYGWRSRSGEEYPINCPFLSFSSYDLENFTLQPCVIF